MTFDVQKIFEREHTLRRSLAARHVFSFSASNWERARVKCRNFGFNGPIMVEGLKVGATAEETTANARANREFLEKVMSSI